MLEPIILAQIFWTGIATASPYVLMTLGFALTLKVSGLWNFAQAGFMCVAFYAMWYALNLFGWPIWAAVAFGAALTAAAALATEVWGVQVLRERNSEGLTFFIFTFILSEFVFYVTQLAFGTEPQTLFTSILSPVQIVGGIAVSDWDMLGVSLMVLGAAALWAFMSFTRDGQFLTAVADNAKLAELYGISAKRAYRVAAVVSSTYLVASMSLVGSHGGVVPNTPMELILAAVIGTLLGGIGRVFAAAAASVFVALLQSYSILVIASRWQNLLLYGFLFAAILLFPRGDRLPRRAVRARAAR